MGIKSKAIAVAILATFFITNTAYATQDLISGDINEGTITFNGIKPQNSTQFSTVLLLIEKKYGAHPTNWNIDELEDFNTITYYTESENPCLQNGSCHEGELIYKTANIRYAEKPSTSKIAEQKIETITKKIDGYNIPFVIDDLPLVDYFLYGYGIDNFNMSPQDAYRIAGNAANFSPSFKQIIENANVYPMLYTQGFGGFDYGMGTGGRGVLTYRGYAYSYIDANAPTVHIIYIPSSTQNTNEAYIEAALKKINTYYKGTTYENALTIKKIGKVTDIYEINDVESDFSYRYGHNFTLENTDTFLLQYRNRELPILIQKSDSRNQAPTVKTVDIENNIIVSTPSSELPYDSIVEANKINNSNRKDIIEELGLTDADIYDINMHSNTSRQQIKKLVSGQFEVSIPVGDKYSGRKVSAYYITENGEKEIHEAAVHNGFAIFYTDHFSEYIIGTTDDNPSINNPATSDIIVPYIIALFGFVSTGLFALSNRK